EPAGRSALAGDGRGPHEGLALFETLLFPAVSVARRAGRFPPSRASAVATPAHGRNGNCVSPAALPTRPLAMPPSGGRTSLGAYSGSTDRGSTRAARSAARQPDPEEDSMPTSRRTRGLIVMLAGAAAACGAQPADDQMAEQPPADEQLAEQPIEEPMPAAASEVETQLAAAREAVAAFADRAQAEAAGYTQQLTECMASEQGAQGLHF